MKNTDIIITKMLSDHWDSVVGIYKQGLETGMATFEKAGLI